jgi:hypothetical protein
MRLRQVRKQYSKWQKKAVALQSWILKDFEEQKIMNSFTEKVITEEDLQYLEWMEQLDSVDEM